MSLIPEITFAGRQLRGSRENQEDCYGFCPLGEGEGGGLLLALADGMGGHQRGEVASRIAVTSFIHSFDPLVADPRRAMIDAVWAANARIGAENDRVGGAPDEMGTTFVGLYLRGNELRWISVGDSPLYLYRARELHRLNAEHASGPVPSPEGGQPTPPMLTSALTGGEINQVDAPEHAFILQAGDILVGASDGIKSIGQERVAAKLEIYAEEPAGVMAETLIAEVDAERKTRQDNLTIAIIKHLAAASPPSPQANPASTPCRCVPSAP